MKLMIMLMILMSGYNVKVEFDFQGWRYEDISMRSKDTKSYIVTKSKENLSEVKYMVLIMSLDENVYNYIIESSKNCKIETKNKYHIFEICEEETMSKNGLQMINKYLFINEIGGEFYFVNIVVELNQYINYEKEILQVIKTIKIT